MSFENQLWTLPGDNHGPFTMGNCASVWHCWCGWYRGCGWPI